MKLHAKSSSATVNPTHLPQAAFQREQANTHKSWSLKIVSSHVLVALWRTLTSTFAAVTHYDVSLQDMCPRLSDAEKQRGWGLPPKLGDADTVGPYEDVEAGSSTSTGQPRIPTFTRLNIDQQVALDRATHDPRVSLNFEMSDGHVPGPQGSSGHYLGSQR